ncbi:MAG TPA: hypothetical protein VJ689_07935, partial [Gaiellaceae bacterium]|nr:hypothetical protein [Gaiellaceae bacterium]
ELRAAGVDKGRYVKSLDLSGAFVLAVGDDRTDQEMYAALPPGAFSVHVGSSVEPEALQRDQFLLESPGEARAFLRELAQAIAGRAAA